MNWQTVPKPDPNNALIAVRVPEIIKREWDALCGVHGVSSSKALRALIEQAINEGKNTSVADK